MREFLKAHPAEIQREGPIPTAQDLTTFHNVIFENWISDDTVFKLMIPRGLNWEQRHLKGGKLY